MSGWQFQIGAPATLPGGSSVAGAFSVQGAISATDDIAADTGSVSGGVIFSPGTSASLPAAGGVHGAWFTWNDVPPTVLGGTWAPGAGGGNFTLLNNYGLGAGGYAFYDGPDGGPWELLATIAGANSGSPGYTTIAGGLRTKVNTLDDGSGKVTLGGALSVGATVPAGTVAAIIGSAGQNLLIEPSAQNGNYNPFVTTGDVAVVGAGSVGGSVSLAIVPWSATASGLRLLPSGEVLTPKNTLDDGAGNIRTLAGVFPGAQPYAIGAKGYLYDVRAWNVPIDGATDATSAFQALINTAVAAGTQAEIFVSAGATILLGATVTVPDSAISFRGVYGLSQIQFTGAGQIVFTNAATPAGVHPQQKFEGLTFIMAGSAPGVFYNWTYSQQPAEFPSQLAAVVFRDCGFFATTACTSAYLVELSNVSQMLFENCSGYTTYGPSGAASAPAQCVLAALGSSSGGLILHNCRFQGWSRAPVVYANGNGQTPNFQGVTVSNTFLMSNGASMGLLAIDVTQLTLISSTIDYCCQNVIFQGDDFYASDCWISYSPSPNNVAETPASGATVVYPQTNVSNVTIQGSGTLAALTVQLPTPQWQGVACSITFDVAVTALTVTAPSGYTINTYPASVSAGQTITFYFNIAVPNNNTWYELASGGPAVIMTQGPRNNLSNLHLQAYAPPVSTDPATIAYGLQALGPTSLNWTGGDASVGLIESVPTAQLNNSAFFADGAVNILGVGGALYQIVQSLFTMNTGGTCNGPFVVAAGNSYYGTDFSLPSGVSQTEQTFHSPVEFEQNIGVGASIVGNASTGEWAAQNLVATASVVGASMWANTWQSQNGTNVVDVNSSVDFTAPVTLGGGVVGSPAVQPAPTPVSGIWYQNTLNGDLDLCLPVQFGANQQASLYIGTTTVSAAPMDWVSTESVGGVFALKGRVPPGCFWALTTTGTINPSGYPSGAIKQ